MLPRVLHSFSLVRLAFSRQNQLLHSPVKIPSQFVLLSSKSFQTPIYNRHKFFSTRTMDSGVIAVIGTTGVGKSNLSIQLAKEMNGEVINGDALQVATHRLGLFGSSEHVEAQKSLSWTTPDLACAEQIS